MKVDILISGFGGQGLMILGKILAKIALRTNKYTTWFPSYGAEMRGGTAHCFVKISDSEIASPFIEKPDVAVILNQLSFNKFKDKLKKETFLVLNCDLINDEASLKGTRKISLPLNKIALECGDIKVANILVLGLLSSLEPEFIKSEVAVQILNEMFSHKGLLEQNLKAFYKGQELWSKEQK